MFLIPQLLAKASTKMNTALAGTMLMFLYLASFAIAGDTNAVDTVPYIIPWSATVES
jgi:hypothetical protein